MADLTDEQLEVIELSDVSSARQRRALVAEVRRRRAAERSVLGFEPRSEGEIARSIWAKEVAGHG